MLRDNIHIDGYVFNGYLIKMDSPTKSGLIMATAEMADNPQEFANEALQTTGTIIHGRNNIGKQIAFRYTVIEQGGSENGQRKYKNRVLVDGEIMWEVKPFEVIGIKHEDGWHSEGRHIVMKQVAKPPIFTSSWLIAPEPEDLPDPWEKDKYKVAWPNNHNLPVGTNVHVQSMGSHRFEASIQIENELLFYIPEEYVVFKYND